MYVYLDETFNIEKGSKNQFMAIAGFGISNPDISAKWYKKLKKKSLPKKEVGKEIKSTNTFSEIYILPYLFSNKIAYPKIEICSIIQEKSFLTQKYFHKDSLNYDKLYLDLAKHLLIEFCRNKKAEKIVIVTFDTFKTKLLNKGNIASTIETELKLKYPSSNFQVGFGTSEEANLQFADQICGIIHKYVFGDNKYLSRLKKLFETKLIKNPFSRQ